ncbi:hypothetical protein ACH4C2_31875, partial [Streptomyces sp. NPDC018057]
RIDIPALPENAITLPKDAFRLPDGSFHLPEGTPLPEGATKLPNGTFRLPDDIPVVHDGAHPLPAPDHTGPLYGHPDGHIVDGNGKILIHADELHKPPTTPAGSDLPHTPHPTREPALVGATPHTAAETTARTGDHLHLGDSLDTDLGDLGRTGDHTPTTPTIHADGDHVPGGQTPEHTPGGHTGDHAPGGNAHEHGAGPSANHEAPTGGTDKRAETAVGGEHGSHHGGQSNAETASGDSGGTADGNGSSTGTDRGVEGTGADGGSDGLGHLPRENQPLPELTPEEKAAHWGHLDEVEQRNPEDFDQLQRDPDKNGGISEPSKDEARVGLDLRDQGRLPGDIQRPPVRDSGEFYSPSTGRYYDIKGVHSDWPPFNNVRDKSQPFRGGYDPANNQRWVNKLSEQIIDHGRTVILDVRNANQVAIDDIRSIVEKNGWEDDVIWYP